MENCKIEKVKIDEIEKLKTIAVETFLETFSPHNSDEDMRKYLNEALSTAQLSKEIRNIGSEFYFAIVENKVIGYLKINFGKSQTELQDDKSMEIERIYVLKQLQGKDIGKFLYHKALDIAVENKVNYIWLGVWEQNLKAISFYKRNGFVEFDKHIFQLGDDKQTDIMMKKEIL